MINPTAISLQLICLLIFALLNSPISITMHISLVNQKLNKYYLDPERNIS